MEVIKNKVYLNAWLIIFISTFIGCNREKATEKLLRSSDKEEVILGSYQAGEKRNEQFVSLLLENANDPRMSTNLRFKGVSVYQAKMIALKKIYDKEPPVKITYQPDSTVINFYRQIFKAELED